MGTTATNTSHPFAPLTPEEIEAAVALVRAARASSEHLRFVTVRLHEPPAEVAHTFRPDDQVPREAFFVLLDKTPGQSGAYEAIVNLTEGHVTSWKRIGEGSGQPSIIFEEFFAAEDAVKADARFRAALERRGITENDGSVRTISNAVCMHEEDDGILWKHWNYRTDHAEVRRSRRLVVSLVATVGPYDYGFFWYFRQDGSIEMDVKLTGIMNIGAASPGVIPEYGQLLNTDGLYAPIHQHFFCFKLETLVDGLRNSVVETNIVAEQDRERNRWGNAFRSVDTTLRTERDAQRDIAQDRSWKIVNPNVRNPANGSFVGYELCPGVGANSLLLATPDSSISRRAAFARHHLWVTPSRPEEQFPAGDYPNQHPGGAGLPAWTAANRSIEDTVLTLWHTVGVMHNPRVEDWPVMPVKHAGFMLRPFNFFEGNPGLDVPPSENHGDNCEHDGQHTQSGPGVRFIQGVPHLASQRSGMERTGILLAIAVALCWGSADTVATFATRRQGTFVTTFISLVTSATMLVLFGPLAYARLSLSPVVFVQSAGLGLLTGVMAAVGYFSLYRGLQLGPLAIVSPVTAADGAIGAVLAVLFLHDFFSPWQFAMLALVFLGILGASTNIVEVRGIARSSGLAGLAAGGVRWGLLAMVTFGVMLFGIGLAAGKWGWYAPILWTRTFAALALFLFAALRRQGSRRPLRPGAASEQKPAPLHAYGVGLALAVGLLETAGLLIYSFDTQLASTGLASAISSAWGIIPLLVGITIFRERPTLYQVFGVALVLLGLFLLAIKPA